MAWETRARGNWYYTRSRRVDGRIVREYIGAGPLAETLAAQDTGMRARWREAVAQSRQARADDAALAALVGDLSVGVDAALVEALTLAGYHRHHRGQWRRRR